MQKPVQGQGGNQNKHGNNLINVTGTNGGGGTSSLPPIVSANNANNNTGKYADPKSARSNMPSNNNNTQKKRKKYRMNYAQQVIIHQTPSINDSFFLRCVELRGSDESLWFARNGRRDRGSRSIKRRFL